eukprot:11301205-Heterocapsa_arctica.AAC.1
MAPSFPDCLRTFLPAARSLLRSNLLLSRAALPGYVSPFLLPCCLLFSSLFHAGAYTAPHPLGI